jgi:hypothetical protein
MRYRSILAVFGAIILGLLSIIAPIFFLSVRGYAAPLFPWLRTAFENLGLIPLLLLTASGFFLGLISSVRFWLLGFSMIAAFPLLSILEGIADRHSHRLLGLELCIYAVLGLIASGSVLAGQKIRAKLRRTSRTSVIKG